MIDSQLLAFAGVSFVLAITPGADTMLVMRSVLSSNRQAGIVTTIGICAGLLVHASFSALGLSLILVRSTAAFEIVKLIGGYYLIFLGLQSIWQSFQKNSPTKDSEVKVSKRIGNKLTKQFFMSGFLTNLLNPKVALFYLAFLPQFIRPTDSLLLKSIALGSIHMFFSFAWLIVVAMLVGQLRRLLTNPQVKRVLLATTGFILMGLGAKLALEQGVK
ncbi:MAG: LysE family translocator [Komarekiella atlantica HA4396-MV6]|jgi:threonine/homoserine/homoserine lactone efflux protein|nr:LysE family translocator [Komarekiella atlantica HA4396-MV6]